jgi:hypothetical protein
MGSWGDLVFLFFGVSEGDEGIFVLFEINKAVLFSSQ